MHAPHGRYLLEECVHLWNELDQPFGDQSDAKVLALPSARLDDVGELSNHLGEREATRLDLLADERHVGLR